MKYWNLSVKRLSRAIALVVLPVVCAVVGPIVSVTAGLMFNQLVVVGATLQSAPQTAPSLPVASPQTSSASEEALPEAPTGMLGSGTRAIGSMIFILAMILIAMILLKRYMPHRFGPLGHKRRIQVLETVPIGDKRTLTLIEIDGNSLLLASTPTSVSLLKEIRMDRNIGVDRSTQPEENVRVEESVRQSKDGGVAQRFKDTLAAEVRATSGPANPGPLARLSRLRQQLEAK